MSTNCCKVSKLQVLLAGDVSLNRGQLKDPCGKCQGSVKSIGICCDRCDSWYHIKCISMAPETYEMLVTTDEQWYCAKYIGIVNRLGPRVEDSTRDCDIYDGLRNKIKRSGLKVSQINVNGLFNRMAQISFLLHETRLEILGISKTHMNGDIKDELMNVEGYILTRRDRKASNIWCGCLIYYKRRDRKASNIWCGCLIYYKRRDRKASNIWCGCLIYYKRRDRKASNIWCGCLIYYKRRDRKASNTWCGCLIYY